MRPWAVAQSSSVGTAIQYILLVLWMMSCFHIMGPISGQAWRCVLARQVLLAKRRPLWVGQPASLQSCCPGGHKHAMSPRPRLFSLLRGGQASQHLCKQSAVMTIEAATMQYLCGSLRFEEVRHTDIKIA